MNERVVRLSGMTCGSCERIIAREAKCAGVEILEADSAGGLVRVRGEDAGISAFLSSLRGKGFPERVPGSSPGSGRGDVRRVVAFASDVVMGKEGTRLESSIFRGFLLSIGALFAATALAGALIPGLVLNPDLAQLVLLCFICSAITIASYAHLSAFKEGMSCMNGMMAGMTLGMASGFLSGALIGATNGMFVGSVAGTVFGASAGMLAGRFCGIMGAMEGMMAGLMSGTMGAMLTVMMINDNLMAFVYILFGAAAILLAGLAYMMHRESGNAPSGQGMELPHMMAYSAVFGAILALLMLFGPRGPVTFP